MFGIGSLAQYYLSTGVFGSYLSVNISWGLGVTFGVFWSFGISGMYLKLVSFFTYASQPSELNRFDSFTKQVWQEFMKCLANQL